jgi:chemotaxis protein MotA
MDIATIGGFILGFFLIGSALVLTGVPGMFISPASVLITFGGAFSAVFISYSMKSHQGLGGVVRNAIFTRSIGVENIIPTLVSFAEKARREGLLSLEDDVSKLDDQFLRKGIQLVVDGTDPELVRSILKTELIFIEERHSTGERIFRDLGTFAPAFGMMGTLIGLIQMLANLEDPSTIASGLATALITTFYGSVGANLIFIPIANKLNFRSREEILVKEVMVEGILSIQSGDNPRIVNEKLVSFLSQKDRGKVEGGRETRKLTER